MKSEYDYNLEKYFTTNKEDSDDTWNSLTLNKDGMKQTLLGRDGIKDYAENRIREQSEAYGYNHDVALWIEDWHWEWGDFIEDLVLPTELGLNKIRYRQLVDSCDSPSLKFYWTTYVSETQEYDYGRWFKNKHEIPVVEFLYKPFGRFDNRIDSVIYSMEMGEYSQALSSDERKQIGSNREDINDTD